MGADSDLCMAPVACDSPALALAHRPRAQFVQGLPHDSATSLVRLDMHLLPSPLSKEVVLVKPCKSQNAHMLADPHGSDDTPMCTPSWSCGQGTWVTKPSDSQTAQGTHPVPMIISPDEHHDMQSQAKQWEQEEEFVLYSAPLIDSQGSDSAESPGAVSPESPADRSILPNSAPGFIISPSPVPFPSIAQDGLASVVKHSSSVGFVLGEGGGTPAGQQPVSEAEDVDDVDALNLLLKYALGPLPCDVNMP